MPTTATSPDRHPTTSPARSAADGAWRFALTSVAAFSVCRLYGLGFGAGLGNTFRVSRRTTERSA